MVFEYPFFEKYKADSFSLTDILEKLFKAVFHKVEGREGTIPWLAA